MQDPLMVKPPDHMARAMNPASARMMSSNKAHEDSGACRESTLQQEGRGAAAAAAAAAHSTSVPVLKCPRCDSMNTKFCYYNNYSFSQPRHFCKNCRRYWTQGGTLRNVPVGGGCRKNKARVTAKLLLHHGGQHVEPPPAPGGYAMADADPRQQAQHAYLNLHGFGADHLHGVEQPRPDQNILRMAFSRLQESLRSADQAMISSAPYPPADTHSPQHLLSLDPAISYSNSFPSSCMEPSAHDLIYMDQLYASRPVESLSSPAALHDHLANYGSSSMHMLSSAEHQRQQHLALRSGAHPHHGSDQPQLGQEEAAAAHIEDATNWGSEYSSTWHHPPAAALGPTDCSFQAPPQLHGSSTPTNLTLHFWNPNSAGWAADLHHPLSAHAGPILN